MRQVTVAIVLVAAVLGYAGRASAAAGSCVILSDGSMTHPKLVDALAAELKKAGTDASVRSELADKEPPAAAGADFLLILTDLDPDPAAASDPAAPPRVELVVIDPLRGARLCAVRLPADRPTADLAAAFAKAVTDTRARVAGGVRQVFLVPFFASHDLAAEHDDRQRGFAQAVQQSLCARPGVGVVEMEHAAAIARELRRRGVPKLERATPVAIEAHYTVTDAAVGGAGPRVDFVVRLTSAAGEPRTIERRGVPLEQADDYLAGDLTKHLLDAAGPKPLSPEQEFAALLSAATGLAQYSSPLAYPVREAALLVNPDAHDLRRQAMGYPAPGPRFNERDEIRLYKLAPMYARIIERALANQDHVEYLIRHKGVDQNEVTFLGVGIPEDLRPAHPTPAAKLAQLRARQDAFRLDTWPLVLKLPPSPIVDPRAFAQRFEFGLLSGAFRRSDRPGQPFAQPAFQWPDMTRDDLAFIAKALAVVPPEMDMSESVIRLLQTVDFTKQPSGIAFSEADYGTFLNDLANADSPACKLYARYGKLIRDANADVLSEKEIRAASKALHADALTTAGPRNAISRVLAPLTGYRAPPATQWTRPSSRRPATTQATTQAIAQSATRPATQAASRPGTPPLAATRRVVPADAPPPPVAAGKWGATRIPFKLRDARGELSPLEAAKPLGNQAGYAFWKVTPAEAFDLFWNDHHVLLHREAGVLDPIVLDMAGRIDDVAWDGRTVWVAQKGGALMALAPTGKVLGRVSTGEGLPPCAHSLRVHAVAPGRVIAVGAASYPQRLWCAAVTAGEGGAFEFKVFHTATLAFTSKPEVAGESTRLMFTPQETFMTAGATGRPELLLMRSPFGPSRRAADAPAALRIDPQSLAVSIAPDPLLPVREAETGEHRRIALPGGGGYLCATNEALLLVPKPGAGADGYRVLATFARQPQHKFDLFPAPDGIHLAGAPWLRYDPKSGKTERLDAPFPPPGEQAYRLQRAGWSAHFGLMVWGFKEFYRYAPEGAPGAPNPAGAATAAVIPAGPGFADLTRTVLPAPPEPPKGDTFRRLVFAPPPEGNRIAFRPPTPPTRVGMTPNPAAGPATNPAAPAPASRPAEVVQYEVGGAFGHVTFAGDAAAFRAGGWSFDDPTPTALSAYHADAIIRPLNSSNGPYASPKGIAALNGRFGITREQLVAVRAAVGAGVKIRPPTAELTELFRAHMSADEGADKVRTAAALLNACGEARAAYVKAKTAWAASVRALFSDKQWADLEAALTAGQL